MDSRVAMDCLKRGHMGSIAEDEIEQYGLAPRASLVTLSRTAQMLKGCESRACVSLRRG